MNRDKVVCPCYHVTKGDVADAVEKGASSYKEVKKATKAGKGCGKCRKKVKKLVKKLLKKKDKQINSVPTAARSAVFTIR